MCGHPEVKETHFCVQSWIFFANIRAWCLCKNFKELLRSRYFVSAAHLFFDCLTECSTFRSSHHRCYIKKVFSEISHNSQENTCARVSFLIKLACNFIKKDSLTQVFSCKFCEISKNTFFTEQLLTTASKRCFAFPKISLHNAYCSR